MKKWIKRYKWYAMLFVFIFIIFIPLVINFLFKQNAPVDILSAEWDASAALGFYGSLVGAGLTVYGVFLTIKYAQSNYKEDVKNRVLPYISLTYYKSKSKRNLFSQIPIENDNEETSYYKEFKLEKVYYIIKDEEIEVKDSLTVAQENVLKQGGVRWEKHGNESRLVDASFVSCPFELENVGNGAAINFRVGFNRTNNNHIYLTPLPLKQNAIFYVHIFSDKITENIKGKYELEFYYEDIYGTQYCQKYDFKIEKDEETGRIYHSIDFTGKQTEIMEDQR